MIHKGTATFIVTAKFTIDKNSMGWDEEPTRDDIENELFDVSDALDVGERATLALSWIEDAELSDVEWEAMNEQ